MMGFTACLDCPRDRGKNGFPSNRACDRRHLRPLLEIRGQERSEDYATAISLDDLEERLRLLCERYETMN